MMNSIMDKEIEALKIKILKLKGSVELEKIFKTLDTLIYQLPDALDAEEEIDDGVEKELGRIEEEKIWPSDFAENLYNFLKTNFPNDLQDTFEYLARISDWASDVLDYLKIIQKNKDNKEEYDALDMLPNALYAVNDFLEASFSEADTPLSQEITDFIRDNFIKKLPLIKIDL